MDWKEPPLTELTVGKSIPASPGAVYDAWLDRSQPGGPWHGCASAIVQARVGGLFFHSVEHAGRTWTHYGRFLVLERPGRIEHTWVSAATRGLETLVTLSLVDQGLGTLATLRHTGVPDDDFGRQHLLGWEWVLGSMEKRFSS